MDIKGNRIEMNPSEGSVSATFRSGDGLIYGIPANYKRYYLEIPNTINVTSAEVDYIFQWKNAMELEISEENELPYRLALRFYKMTAMKQLWKFQFRIHRGSFAKLSIVRFLDRLPALEDLTIIADGLSMSQIGRFTRNQNVSDNWIFGVNVTLKNTYINYVKVPKFSTPLVDLQASN